jgi:hypothetical protein
MLNVIPYLPDPFCGFNQTVPGQIIQLFSVTLGHSSLLDVFPDTKADIQHDTPVLHHGAPG